MWSRVAGRWDMSAPIRYRLNWEKAIEAIVWLAQEKPGIGVFHVAKVLFYADKAHLQQYARPILGDTYIAMEHGPVPSGVHDLIDRNSFLDPDLLEATSEAIEVKRDGYPQIIVQRPPNLKLFSETDLQCLRWALDRYGDLPFGRLRDLTHRERAWVEAPANGPMDYALMIDDDVPNRKELLEEIRETAAYVVT